MSRKKVNPVVFTLNAPPALAIAIKTAADMEMATQSEWLRRAAMDRCLALGINPAEMCDAAQ
jgi:hypothetical protein